MSGWMDDPVGSSDMAVVILTTEPGMQRLHGMLGSVFAEAGRELGVVKMI